MCSVPATHISEDAAPCPYCIAPCPNFRAPCPIYIAPLPELKTNFVHIILYNLCFCLFRQLMNCTMLRDLCPCFHRSPTKLCPDLVSFACWIVPEFLAFARKSVPDLVVHALNCAQYFVVCARILVVRARLCSIYFAPCLFPT